METTIEIKRIAISNFKVIKSLEFDLGKEVLIEGANATGKTTIFDAMYWCWFGKNSHEVTAFSIKNLNDTSLNRNDHSVELTMLVNGELTVAKRTYKETWTKKKGSEQASHTGHETEFLWNKVPLNATSYAKKVSEIIDEQLFRQLTNPFYFNVTMKPADRRKVLADMAEEVTDEKVINGTEVYRDLFKTKGKKSFEEYKKEIAFAKLNLKKQLADIPSRIEELKMSNPLTQNWTALKAEKESKENAVKTIKLDMEGKLASFDKDMAGIRAKQSEAITAARKMGEIENELTKRSYAQATEANKSLIEAKYNLSIVRQELRTRRLQLGSLEARLPQIENELNTLREAWKVEHAKTFTLDNKECTCFACNRSFPENDLAGKRTELSAKFELIKQQAKDAINAEGVARNLEKQVYVNQMTVYLGEIAQLQTRENDLLWSEDAVEAKPKPINLAENLQYQALKLISEQTIEVKTIDLSEQKQLKQVLQWSINELNVLLSTKDQIDKNAIRIAELAADEKRFNKEFTDLEKIEFTIASFQKAKMSLIEDSINGRFKVVKWKMFNTLGNGGEEECCVATVNGIPYPDLNHARQIDVGIDCANAFSDYNRVYAPIIIDNSESCNSLLRTNSQLIKLAVTTDPHLKITNFN